MAKVVRKAGLDKFYTIPSIAQQCITTVGTLYPWSECDMVIEPSSGNGSFYNSLPVSNDKKLAIDISPEHDNCIKHDFLTYVVSDIYKKVLIIGNPPFGKNASLAIKFFNHASQNANTMIIAFIVPKIFRRVSVQNKLNSFFHLKHDEDIPMKPCSFSPPMMVKCCFQIWERRNEPRENVVLPTVHNDFTFLNFLEHDENKQPKPRLDADFVMKAYGSKCGEIFIGNLQPLRPKSWHWIKAKIPINTLIERFKTLDYSISLNSTRQNSLGKGDLIKLYSDKYN